MDIWQMLRKRYPEREYALMAEVSDASGFSRSNSADYIAVSLWPSRGLAVHGIELKSNRYDWLRELKKPDKAENIYQYCDHFWLLTKDETIARPEEIPTTWGWLCIKNERILCKKEAPKLNPIDISRHFMCAMLKRAADKTGFVHTSSIQDRLKEVEEAAYAMADRENKRKLDKANDLIQIVEEFEKSSGLTFSGLKVNTWYGHPPDKIGEQVKFMLDGGTPKIKKDLERLKVTAENIFNEINSALQTLNNEQN